MDMFKAISELTTMNGVTGNEFAITEKVLEYFRKYTDDVWRDNLGNAYARIGSGKPVVLFMAHMDEVGMMVTDIEDNGMLRIRSVAGVDPRVLPGSRVIVRGATQDYPGVVGAIPPHLLGGTNKEEAYKIDDLACDIGYPSEKVKELVKVGDYVTFAADEPMKLKNDLIAGKTFDDRALVVAMIEALDILSKRKLNCTAVFCASVQEERGGGGAIVGPHNVKPDIAIATDVCHAPTPGAKPFDTIDIEKVAVCTGGNIHPKMYEMIQDIAKENNIATDVDVCMGHTGTDAWDIQVQNGGIPTGLISLPLRYMHTCVEIISLETLRNCARMLAEFAAGLSSDWEEKLCLDD